MNPMNDMTHIKYFSNIISLIFLINNMFNYIIYKFLYSCSKIYKNNHHKSSHHKNYYLKHILKIKIYIIIMNTQSVVQLTHEQTTAFNTLNLSEKFVIKPETTKMRDSSNRLYRGDSVLFHFSPSGPYRYGVITDIEIDGDT